MSTRGTRSPGTAWSAWPGWIDAVRAFGLIAVIVSVSLADPGPGTPGPRGVLIAVTLALSSAGWVAWLVSGAPGSGACSASAAWS